MAQNSTTYTTTVASIENISRQFPTAPPFDFTELNIEVRDCRSNQVVRNAQVRKLIIRRTDRFEEDIVIEQTFGRDNRKPANRDIPRDVRGSMQVLQSLGYGFNISVDRLPADYNVDWRNHYNTHWGKSFPHHFIDNGNPSNEMIGFLVDHHNSHRVTSNEGVLKVYIPTSLLDTTETLEIEVGFWDFPIALEAIRWQMPRQPQNESVFRCNPEGEGTDFQIVWSGNQSTDWGAGFGWFIEYGGRRSQLKVSELMQVRLDRNTQDFDTMMLSMFYQDDGERPHFVLFAMQWCQPVWDEIADVIPQNGVRSNNQSFVRRRYSNERDNSVDWITNLNMHIVTRYNAGWLNPYGHYYGFYEPTSRWHRDRDNRHAGIDFFGGYNNSSRIFAIHGGHVRSNVNIGDAGYWLELFFVRDTGGPKARYLHLGAPASVNTQNEYVMCGQDMGVCGRTGRGFTLTTERDNPSHMHFELRGHNAPVNNILNGNLFFGTAHGLASLVDDETNRTNLIDAGNRGAFSLPDSFNARLFQTNLYPVMLPCQCHYDADFNQINNCTFSNLTLRTARRENLLVPSRCWAIREYPYSQGLLDRSSNNHRAHQPIEMYMENEIKRFICPHVFTSPNPPLIMQLHAKLRFVFENAGIVRGIPNNQRLINFRIDVTARNNGIANRIDDTTRNWVQAIFQAYQEVVLGNTDPAITRETEEGREHIELFIRRYITPQHPASGNALVDLVFDWFQNFNYQ